MNEDNKAEWAAICTAMEQSDEHRERVIKEMRAAQKNSKNAIFALQRKDHAAAQAKLDEATRVILQIFPLVQESPELRKGTFSAAVEEWVEGKAFQKFLLDGELVTLAALQSICKSWTLRKCSSNII